MTKTRVWAHRGASAYAPENTLDAFETAIKMGADGIELDVHLSSDGEIIVNHDSDLKRTSHTEGKIKEMTLAELKKATPNAKFEGEFLHAKIPTLREVYDLIRPTDLTVNVEIKSDAPELEAKLYRLCLEMKMRERVIYSSFKASTLLRMQELDPCAAVAPLYDDLAYPWLYGASFNARALHPNHKYVLAQGQSYVDEAHRRGMMVNPFTVDKEDVMEILAGYGCDAIITNVPDIARKVLDK